MEQIDQQRERIQEDLRGLIAGDVRCDDVFLQMYATDASIYEVRPLGVVRPRSTRDVAACLQYASENRVSVHARGAGTGMAGESLGGGLVIDFSKYMRRILRTEADSVRVQPGIVHQRLNIHLLKSGRLFGPNPASSSVTTLGSTIAIDGAGSRWLKYGSARDHVRSLQVVLADGHAMEIGREPLVAQGGGADARKRALVGRIASLLRSRSEVLRQSHHDRPFNHGGYNLDEVLSEDGPGGGYLDLARLIVGSEGTLALVTEATLATQPLPGARGVVLLLFDTLDGAARAICDVLAYGPALCDLMDRRHVSLARENEVRLDVLLPRETEAALLLVEMHGEDLEEVCQRLDRVTEEIVSRKRLAMGSRAALEDDQIDLLLNLAVMAQPGLYRMKGPSRPVPVVEDMAVSPACLPEFIVRVQNVLKQHQVTASLFCHAGQGQLHLQPFLDLSRPDEIVRMRRLADDLYDELFDVGGSISSEHGCGLSRTPYLARQYGGAYEVFGEIKRIFDPGNILNPGKIVDGDSDLLVRNLRPVVAAPAERPPGEAADEAPPLRNLVELQMDWEPAQVAEVARQCHGCGKCRSQSPHERMCPLFRVLPAEEASPRSKANLIRGVLSGRLPLTSLTGEQFKEVADLCYNCHACRLECPASVDIPRLVTEGKGAYVAANGLSLSDWVMTHLEMPAGFGSLISPLANRLLGSRAARWMLEKLFGLALGRKLPRVAARSFLRQAARRRWTRPVAGEGRKVALFLDTYANHFDTQLAEAFVAVLHHHGVQVFVPPDQKPAGTPAFSLGALERARRLAGRNVAVLAEAIRQGYHVVTTEPAAALTLVREYRYLADDEETRLVSENTSEATSYLWRMHTAGELRLDLRPVEATLGYHLPCRLRALEVGAPGENLLGLIPGLRVRRIEEGCSGMAGTYGMKREHYRTSLRVGWGLITRLRQPDLQAGTTECSTCRMQMEQGTTKPTVHPIKLLALSYGLMPQLAALLTRRGEELLLT